MPLLPKPLALVTFTTLIAIAAKLMSTPLFLPEGSTILADQCPVDIARADQAKFPYRLCYTGISPLDDLLCGMVAIYLELTDVPHAYSFLHYCFTSFLPVSVILSIEALRPGSMGVISLIYWIFYIAGGNLKNRHAVHLSTVGRDQVAAVAFAVLVGNVIPSQTTLCLQKPRVVAFWHLFPAYVALAQYLYTKAFTSNLEKFSGKSGLPLIQSLYYYGCFAYTASEHILFVWPKVIASGWTGSFAPPLLNPSSVSTSVMFVLHNFLKWELVFTLCSFALGSLWFARTRGELLGFILWYIVATPAIGMGAAVTGVFIYDNALLSRSK